jgi:hypothetical protein
VMFHWCGQARPLSTRLPRRCQYLHFCTSKASKLSTCRKSSAGDTCPGARSLRALLVQTFVLAKQVNSVLLYLPKKQCGGHVSRRTKFTCFTSTKVQRLTCRESSARYTCPEVSDQPPLLVKRFCVSICTFVLSSFSLSSTQRWRAEY